MVLPKFGDEPFFVMKTIDETIGNYLIGTIQWAYKTKRYWIKKGFDENSAIGKATKYAFGQMEAGIGETFNKKDVEEIFREIGVIANVLADACKQANDNK